MSSVEKSLNYMQNTMQSEVNYLKTNSVKNRVQSCSSKQEVCNEIDDIFDSSQKKMINTTHVVKENIKANIPDNYEERQKFVKLIVPKISETVEQTTSFWESMFNAVGSFFSAIFNAIAWPIKKVGEFVEFLGKKVKSIFSWIGSWF